MSSISPELETFLLQLLTVNQDLPGITNGLSSAQFNWAPAPGRWSIGQCVEHLNITTERYLPVLRQAIGEARTNGRLASGPYVLGFFERWFVGVLEPPVGFKVRAPKGFVATAALAPEETLERWSRLQAQLADCIRSAEGIDLRRVKVKSQFGPVSFSLNGTLAVLLTHQRRHLWQARVVRTAGGFPVS